MSEVQLPKASERWSNNTRRIRSRVAESNSQLKSSGVSLAKLDKVEMQKVISRIYPESDRPMFAAAIPDLKDTRRVFRIAPCWNGLSEPQQRDIRTSSVRLAGFIRQAVASSARKKFVLGGLRPIRSSQSQERELHLRVFLDSLLAQIPPEERQDLASHVRDTPARVTRMYENELLIGYHQDPAEILSVDFADGYDEIVLVKDIAFYSLCAHHLLPFYGKAHVAYLPSGRVVGLSKLARLVECYARRLQIQERMTEQVARALMTYLRPYGAACIIDAEHLCMGCRGVSKPGGTTVTSVMLGWFRSRPAARTELLALVRGR